MGRVSKAKLLDPKFAEVCIKEIMDVFGDYDVSLAIYNKEAGLKDELYIPDKAEEKKKAEYVDWERKIKQAQQELSTLRQQAEEESKRKPAAPVPEPLYIPEPSIPKTAKPEPIKAKFCGKCGRERTPKDIFCGKCGNRLD
jgi:hypothetical protein